MAEKLDIEDIDSYINKKTVLLGLCSNVEHEIAVTFFILHAKYFIFIKKINKSSHIHFNEYMNILKSKLETNIVIAKHQQNNTFIQKMSALELVLQ